MPLAAHGATHPGRRPSNEDAFVVNLSLGLFIVADGMGGHQAGEVASDLAVRAIEDAVQQADRGSAPLLAQAVRRANEHVLAAAASNVDYAGMGTTVVAVLVTDSRVEFTSVGDSRIYRWHDLQLTQLTRDDSWITNVLEHSVLSDTEARQHPMRHVLTKVVGLRTELPLSGGECPFVDGDALLLCSDGLHGSVPEDRLASALGGGGAVSSIAQHLVDEAIARGATDNVTAVVVRREP